MDPQSRWIEGSPRLHLLDWGGVAAGEPMLMLHGMAGNAHWWDRVVPELQQITKHDDRVQNIKSEQKFRLGRPAALDFRGHGDSDWMDSEHYNIEGLTQDIESARKALGWERMILAGHSLGGRIALEYAMRHPDRLSSLIAVDFLPEVSHQRSAKFARALKRLQPVYSSEEEILRHFRLEPPGTLLDEPSLRNLARHCIKKTERGFTWKFDWQVLTLHYEPVWPILPKIRTPTLLVRGESSAVMHLKEYERMLQQIPGAHGVEIPRAHHHVPLDTPKKLTQRIIEFLMSSSHPPVDKR